MAPTLTSTMDIPEALEYTLSFMARNYGRVPRVSVFDLHEEKEYQTIPSGSSVDTSSDCSEITPRQRGRSPTKCHRRSTPDSDNSQTPAQSGGNRFTINGYDKGGKPNCFKCGTCEHVTKSKGDMVRHLETKSHQEKAYYCNCRLTYTRKDALLRHIRRSSKKTLHRRAK